MSELLVTIDRGGQLTELRTLLSALAMRHTRHRVVALELDIFEQLQSERIPSVHIDDLVDARAYDGIDAEAFELAHGWFPRDDPTLHDGVSLGRLVAWEMTYFFAEALRCSRNVNALMEAMSPAAVLVLSEPVSGDTILLHPTENFHHDALLAACARRGIPCELSVPLPESARLAGEPGARAASPSRARLGHRAGGLPGRSVLTLSTQCVTPALTAELFRKGFERLLVLGDPGGLGDGEPRVSRRSLDLSGESREAAEARAQLGRVWQRRGETILEAISESAPSLRGLDCLRRRLDGLFAGKLAAAYDGFLKHRQLLAEENVGAVLLHNDVTEPGCSMALAARREGVPSMVLLHGAVGHPIGALPVSADRVGVYGPYFSRWFEDNGVPSDRLVEIGSPRFCETSKGRYRQLRGESRAALRLDPGKKLVVLALQHCLRSSWFANVHWQHLEWRRLVDAVLEATADRSDAEILIKLHPLDPDAELWNRWLDDGRRRAGLSMIQDLDGEPLLAAADALVTGWSTLGLEAVLAGVPLMTVNFTGRPTPLEYHRLGLADHINDPCQMAAGIDRLLTAPRQVTREQLSDLLLCWGNESASRTAEVVASLGRTVSSHERIASAGSAR